MCFIHILYNVKSNSTLDSVDAVVHGSVIEVDPLGGLMWIKFGFFFLATASKFDLANVPAYDKRML